MNTLRAIGGRRISRRTWAHGCLGLGLAYLVAAGAAWAGDDDGTSHHEAPDRPQHCPLAAPGGNDLAAGASDRITTCEVLRAIQIIRKGRIASLGHVYTDAKNPPIDRITPLLFGRTYSLESLLDGQGIGSNRSIFHDDQIQGNLTQIGTQFDSLRHAGTLNDEDGKDWFNGLSPDQLGVENVRPLFTRGILIDIAGLKGRMLQVGEEITIADVHEALRRQGLSSRSITRGDAVLFNTGWSHMYDLAEQGRPEDVAAWGAGEPGIGLEVANWLAEKQVVLVGSDNWAVEYLPVGHLYPDGRYAPVHAELLGNQGIFLHENLDFSVLLKNRVYVFVYVFVPVPFAGASGSPGSPIAIW
jgi:kynurenine formamidase